MDSNCCSLLRVINIFIIIIIDHDFDTFSFRSRFSYPQKKVEIFVGSNNLKEGGSRYPVEYFLRHKEYDNPRYANDIGLIRLNDSIEFNDNVQPIKYSKKYVEGGVQLLLTGWGLTSSSGSGSVPDQLQVLNVTSISEDECEKYHKSLVHKSHLCTLNTAGEGACYVSNCVLNPH